MQGFEPTRFDVPVPDHLYCLICKKVVRDPFECNSCGQLYCATCIANNRPCSQGCIATGPQYSKIGGAMLKLYNNLAIKCANPTCTLKLSVLDLINHEKQCLKVKCLNAALCNEFAANIEPYQSAQVCGEVCSYTIQLFDAIANGKQQLEILKKFLSSQNAVSQVLNNQGIISFKWDHQKIGQGIQISTDQMSVFLKESAYMFRTAISNVPFMNGVHYWEILADGRTENELKIGVCYETNFNLNSAFCDYATGWAYYGLAQLRNGSNASGTTFGKRFKREGVLGVCLNMDAGIMKTKIGTLSFGLDGEFMGVAFTNEALKKGPIYAAVALLHCAGCSLRTGLRKPGYMK